MSQSTTNKISAAIRQYELDRPALFKVDRIITDYEYAAREQKLVRKLDVRILPVLALFYFMSALTSRNISNAHSAGMSEVTHLTDLEYRNCLMIFLVSFCAAQVPSNIMCQKTTPAFWLPTLMCCWGVVMTCMGLIVDYKGLFWSRFFLGIFEAGMIPGIAMYLTRWYRRSELQVRLAVILAVGCGATSLSGLLAWCIVKMDKVGGMEGWRWIFVLEGCTSVVVGTFAYMFLSNYPSSAKFLKDDEKEMVVVRIKMDEGWPAKQEGLLEYAAEEKRQRTWRDIKKAVWDWQSYSHALVFFCSHAVMYAVESNLPLLIEDMKFVGPMAQLMSIPIYVTAGLGSVVLSVVSDKVGFRSPILIFCFFMMLAGYLLVLISKIKDTRHSVTYAGLFIAALGAYAGFPSSIAWLASNSLGAGKRNISLALQVGCGSLSGIVLCYVSDSQTGGQTVVLLLVALGIVVTIGNVAMYRRLNERHKLELFRDGDGNTGLYSPVRSIQELVRLGDKNPYFEYTY